MTRDRGDNPLILFDALPANVVELAKEADQGLAIGTPDYLPAVLCQVGPPRSPRSGERTNGSAAAYRSRARLIHIATEATMSIRPHLTLALERFDEIDDE